MTPEPIGAEGSSATKAPLIHVVVAGSPFAIPLDEARDLVAQVRSALRRLDASEEHPIYDKGLG